MNANFRLAYNILKHSPCYTRQGIKSRLDAVRYLAGILTLGETINHII